MKLLSLSGLIVLLSGCAAPEHYRMYLEVQKIAINAESLREAARYQALTKIAEQGDNNVKMQTVINLSAPQKPLVTIQVP